MGYRLPPAVTSKERQRPAADGPSSSSFSRKPLPRVKYDGEQLVRNGKPYTPTKFNIVST